MKILIVDDEKKIADVMSERLGLRGFDVTPVYDGKSALSHIKEDTYDGVILDLRLPDIDGIEVLRQTMNLYPGMTVVIVSGHGSEQDFKTCLELGAVACFHKPVKIAAIAETLEQVEIKNDEFN